MEGMNRHLWFALHDRPTLYAEWITLFCVMSIALHEAGIWRFQ